MQFHLLHMRLYIRSVQNVSDLNCSCRNKLSRGGVFWQGGVVNIHEYLLPPAENISYWQSVGLSRLWKALYSEIVATISVLAMAEESFPVKLYIYDISMGMARALSQGILGRHIDGVWHTGIVVYGQEYFFGGTGGIEACAPGGTILGQPTQIVDLGETEIPFDVFMSFLHELSDTSYRAEKYHLFHHNCNNFSSEVAQFLTGKDIPSHITSLPQEILSTPFGAMIQPFVDAMHVQGGHSPFK